MKISANQSHIMVKVVSEILFDADGRLLKFRGICDMKLTSSWEALTDRLTMTFPRRVFFEGTPIYELLKRGQQLSVSIGYDDNFVEVFTGYIGSVGANTPLELKCEDEMYLLKTGEFTKSYRSVDVETLIKDVVGNIVPYKVTANQNLGQFRISKQSPAKVLDYLKEHYHIKSFFKNGTLYVGLAYLPSLQRTRTIAMNYDVKENSLEYRRADEVKLLLKGIIKSKSNKKDITIEIGDKQGEVRTFTYFDRTESEVRKQLDVEMLRFKYTGYRGSITVFGTDDFSHGDAVIILDPNYPDREGRYLIKSVEVAFGNSGYSQKLEIEAKI